MVTKNLSLKAVRMFDKTAFDCKNEYMRNDGFVALIILVILVLALAGFILVFRNRVGSVFNSSPTAVVNTPQPSLQTTPIMTTQYDNPFNSSSSSAQYTNPFSNNPFDNL